MSLDFYVEVITLNARYVVLLQVIIPDEMVAYEKYKATLSFCTGSLFSPARVGWLVSPTYLVS